MKKKLFISRTVKLVALALAVIATIFALQGTLLRRIDQNALRMDAFYLEDKESLDAVLIGASDVYAGYSAPYAYDKYGLTSYPYATQSTPSDVVLSQIKEVIKYQNPKMIIVEINAFLYTANKQPDEVNRHLFADNIPRDEIWSDYIKENISPDMQLEFYMPIWKFHGIWDEYPRRFKTLSADMKIKNRGYALLRGFRTASRVFDPHGKIINNSLHEDDTAKALNKTCKDDLIKTLDYLKENNITNVVFMRFPHVIRQNNGYGRFCRSNEAGNIIREYGYDFINLERDAMTEGFVLDEDWYNWDHLNIIGTEKCTDYIAKMLIEKYGVTPADLTPKQKESWEASAETYHKLYNYSEYQMSNQPKSRSDKIDDDKDILKEDEKTLKLIDDFAAEHPEFGKYAKK